MKSNRSWLLVIPVILVLILVVGYFLIQARVPELVSYSPSNPDQFQLTSSKIVLVFSQPMDQASVEGSISFKPTMAGDFAWESNTVTFTPDESWKKGSTVEVLLADGMRSEFGLELRNNPGLFKFQVENQSLLYLSPASEYADIHIIDPISGNGQQLTNHQAVLDFSPHPNGELIYYTIRNAVDGTDLYIYDRRSATSSIVLDCGNVRCSQVEVIVQGNGLAFTRQEPGGLPEIWLMDTESLEAERLSEEGEHSQTPTWSGEEWLAYYNLSRQEYVLVSLVDFTEYSFDNQTGEHGTWSGEVFIAPELIKLDNLPYDPAPGLDDYFTSHLIGFNTNRQTYKDLSGDAAVEDTNPESSPDGNWLAFTRKYQDPAAWQLGRQLWLMRSNGSNPIPLADMPDHRILGIAWRPDSKQIAFVRFEQTTIIEPPEIWLITLDGEEAFRIVVDAYAPTWLP